jgi:hypothetical protein
LKSCIGAIWRWLPANLMRTVEILLQMVQNYGNFPIMDSAAA